MDFKLSKYLKVTAFEFIWPNNKRHHCRMLKKSLTILPLLFLGMASYTQVSSSDTTKNKDKVEDWVIDSTIDYDLLLQDMESFLDSISSPHSYLLGSLAIGRGYFNYTNKSNVFL